MKMTMREVLKPVLDSVSALKMQVQAALSIPLTDAAQLDAPDGARSENMVSYDAERPAGKSFKCVADRPGYLTSNGLGSLEVGAAPDD